MDKTTRMLLLHSRLIKGGKVNKITFCMETDCLPRSFDRDIEDIRLYLSETFDGNELLYDRGENAYYLSGMHRTELESMEYQFIERILLDTGTLRKDEMDNLLQHLVSNAEKASFLLEKKKELLQTYEEPLHKKALLKMHGDLTIIIRNQSVIKVRYTKMDGNYVERELLPCSLKYDMGYLYLVAYLIHKEEKYPAYFRLDRMHSFEVVRSQTKEERHLVEQCNSMYAKGITQMYGGEFIEIEVLCEAGFYPYIHDKFWESEVMEQDNGKMRMKLWAFDLGFVKWIMSQPVDKIQVVRPMRLKQTIMNEAQNILLKYGGQNGEKD